MTINCKCNKKPVCDFELKTCVPVKDNGMGITFCQKKCKSTCCEQSKCEQSKCEQSKCEQSKCNQLCICKIGLATYGSKCTNDTNTDINGVCEIDKHRVLVCASDAKFPLWSHKIDENGCIVSEPQFWKIFLNKDLSFVGKLGHNKFGTIPDNKFEILCFSECDCNYTHLKFENSVETCLFNKLINCIESCDLTICCEWKKKYKLVGFFIRCGEIYFAVEMTSKKSKKLHKLYLLKCCINVCKCTLSNNLTCVSSYCLYENARAQCLTKNDAKNLKVTGISHKNDEILVLTRSCSIGHVWSTKITHCLGFVGASLNLKYCKNEPLVINKPSGIAHLCHCDKVLIVSDNVCCNDKYDYNYYVLNQN